MAIRTPIPKSIDPVAEVRACDRPRYAIRDRQIRALDQAASGCRSLWPRPRVARRRRGACHAAERRARHEHRPRRLRRSRLEARRGPSRLGRAAPARELRAGAPSGRHPPVRRGDGEFPALRLAQAGAACHRRDARRRTRARRTRPPAVVGQFAGVGKPAQHPSRLSLRELADHRAGRPAAAGARRFPPLHADESSGLPRAACMAEGRAFDARSVRPRISPCCDFPARRDGRRARRGLSRAGRAARRRRPRRRRSCALYERKLVLVRPDGHVAWRGDAVAHRCNRA